MTSPSCPKCQADYTYEDGPLWVCPSCSHEWSRHVAAASAPQEEESGPSSPAEIRDANGTVLQDGDTVVVIKDLKVKGASGSLKSGTKVRGIRLIHDAPDDHDIACKIDGFGAMNLKSKVVRKA